MGGNDKGIGSVRRIEDVGLLLLGLSLLTPINAIYYLVREYGVHTYVGTYESR